MYRNLVLYRNELKNNIVPKYKLIGIISELLLSKEIFTKNSQIEEFLKEIFDIKYKEYVMKSRTLIVARCCRKIIIEEEKNCVLYKKRLLHFIIEEIEIIKKESGIKSEKNQFDGWLK